MRHSIAKTRCSPLRGNGVVSGLLAARHSNQKAERPRNCAAFLLSGCGGPQLRYMRPWLDQDLFETDCLMRLPGGGDSWAQADVNDDRSSLALQDTQEFSVRYLDSSP